MEETTKTSQFTWMNNNGKVFQRFTRINISAIKNKKAVHLYIWTNEKMKDSPKRKLIRQLKIWIIHIYIQRVIHKQINPNHIPQTIIQTLPIKQIRESIYWKNKLKSSIPTLKIYHALKLLSEKLIFKLQKTISNKSHPY